MTYCAVILYNSGTSCPHKIIGRANVTPEKSLYSPTVSSNSWFIQFELTSPPLVQTFSGTFWQLGTAKMAMILLKR